MTSTGGPRPSETLLNHDILSIHFFLQEPSPRASGNYDFLHFKMSLEFLLDPIARLSKDSEYKGYLRK